jgi:thioesterase domain-containing protein
LLAALALAIDGVRDKFDPASGQVLLDVEANGRADLDGKAEVDRTVGWFAAPFPLRVHLSAQLDPRGGPAERLRGAVEAVGRERAAVPREGIGFGLWAERELAAGDSNAPASLRPQVGFSFVGDAAAVAAALPRGWTLADRAQAGLEPQPDALTHAMRVDSRIEVTPAGHRLAVRWSWDAEAVDSDRVADIADAAERWLYLAAEQWAAPPSSGTPAPAAPVPKAEDAADAEPEPAAEAGDSSFLAPVVQLHPDGGGRPLFCVHGAWGLAWPYGAFAAHLRDVPLIGLQAPRLGSAAPGPETWAAFGVEYAERIRRVQGEGPYRLLGWTFGAFAAHQIALALQAAGEEVEYLALLGAQPGAPEAIAGEGELALRLFDEVGYGSDSPEARKLAEALDYEGLAALARRDAGDDNLVLTAAQMRRLVAALRAHGELANSPLPGNFEGDADLVVATAGLASLEGDVAAWAIHVAGALRVLDVETTAEDLLRPSVVARYAPKLFAPLTRRGRAARL